jgi:hypothetical protein
MKEAEEGDPGEKSERQELVADAAQEHPLVPELLVNLAAADKPRVPARTLAIITGKGRAVGGAGEEKPARAFQYDAEPVTVAAVIILRSPGPRLRFPSIFAWAASAVARCG